MKRLSRSLLLAVTITALSASYQREVKLIRFTTREASWLSFDVSPDGRWLSLDILGDVWRLPINGGTAVRLTNVARDSGEFLDPVISPDGRRMVTHGEYRGRNGVYILSAAGGIPRWIAPAPVSDDVGGAQAAHSPSWIDSSHVLITRNDSTTAPRVAPTTRFILLDVETGVERNIDQAPIQRLPRKDPVVSADGRELYFTVRNTVRTFPPSGRLWRMPASGGAALPVTAEGIQAYFAAPAPDGLRLAFLAFDRSNAAQVWLQTPGDSAAVQLTHAEDVQPTRVRWVGRDTIIYAAGGRLWRIDTRSRAVKEIPFRATIEFERAVPVLPATRFPLPGTRMAAIGSRGVGLAPGGDSYATIALDTLWIVATDPAASGSPRALAGVPPSASAPAWSPDERSIAWSADSGSGADLYITDVSSGRTRRATALPGDELTPSWSPDGQHILFTHVVQDTTGRQTSRLRTIRSDAVATSLAETQDLGGFGGTMAVWNPAGTAVLVLGPANNVVERTANLRALDGSPPRPVRGLVPDAWFVQWLPSGDLVFLSASRLWRASFDEATRTVGPAAPIGTDGAMFLSASRNGRILYVSEKGMRLRDLSGGPVAARSVGGISYVVPEPAPILVRHVRILDRDRFGSPQDVLMRGGRIERIAPAGTLPLPPGARLVDAANRRAIPGLIDLHEHSADPVLLRGLLQFGVTTVRNVGGNIRDLAAARDAVNAGAWAGPRMTLGGLMYQTDWPFTDDTNVGLAPERDAQHLERAVGLLRGFGGNLVKMHSYVGWAAEMRIVAAAHALGLRATGHCAYPLAVLASGIDTKEHAGWECTVRDAGTWSDDLIQLYRATQVPVIPTLGLRAFWIRHAGRPDIIDTPELQATMDPTERAKIRRRLSGNPPTPDQVMNHARMVDAVRKLHRANVPLGVGTDNNLPDGVQREMEELVDAGLSPLEAIAGATSVAARISGAERQVGRIAPGLFGDLVILDADPSADIGNARRIWMVIQGGRVVRRPPEGS